MLTDVLPRDVLAELIGRYLTGPDACAVLLSCRAAARLAPAVLAPAYVNALIRAHGLYRYARYQAERIPMGARASVALALARSFAVDGSDGLSLAYCNRHQLWSICRQIIDIGASYSLSRSDLLEWIGSEPQIANRLMMDERALDNFLHLLHDENQPEPDWHRSMCDLIQSGFRWETSIFYHGDLEHRPDTDRQNRHDLLQFILEHGADPESQPNTAILAPLLSASIATISGQCHGPIQSLLLLNGSNPNQIVTSNGMTPLQIGAARAHVDIVHELIRAGADLNYTGRCSGLTPLHHVANCLQPQSRLIVDLLLSNGADLNPLDDDGLTPMHYAATRNNIDVVEALLDNGYDAATHCRSPMAPSLSSSAAASVAIAASESRGNQWTPAFFAIINRSDRVLRLLLDRGCSPSQTGIRGKSLLHAAVESQNMEACQMLIQSGANINQSDEYGVTPLGSAIFRNHTEAAHLLLNYGVRLDTHLLHTAARLGNRDLMLSLARSCHDLDAADSMGKTALMYAARFGNDEAAEVLIQFAADINLADRAGFTALFYARAYGNHQVEIRLLSAGATKERRRNGLKPFCSGSSGLFRSHSLIY